MLQYAVILCYGYNSELSELNNIGEVRTQVMEIWYSCNQHIDIVIEEMIDEFENAPVLEVISASHSCHWCGKRAIYQLQCLQEQEEDK